MQAFLRCRFVGAGDRENQGKMQLAALGIGVPVKSAAVAEALDGDSHAVAVECAAFPAPAGWELGYRRPSFQRNETLSLHGRTTCCYGGTCHCKDWLIALGR